MKKNIFILTLATIALFSCNSNKHKAELNTIDSLIVVADSTKTLLNSTDSVNLEKAYNTLKENTELLKIYFDDKKDSTWATITAYSAIYEPFRRFNKRYPKFNKELLQSKTQLNNLKTDIKEGTIEEGKIKGYLNEELKNLDDLRKEISMTMKDGHQYLHVFDSLNPKMEVILKSLQKNNNKKEGKTVKNITEEDD